MMDRALDYVELDIQICLLLYGTTNVHGTCSAELGVTGPIKCFNTLETCQVPDDRDLAPVTLRFAKDTGFLPSSIPAIPSLLSVEFSPPTLSLGKSLGERASISFVFRDHAWGDTGEGYDKYRTERPYDPAAQGMFWAKLRARHRSLRGRPIRSISGYLGQSLVEMETRHFIIDSVDGPRPDGTFTIVAKDVLKLADGDRSQTPPLSTGFLTSNLSNVATSFTISPAGVGNLEYPASGSIVIGGNEQCTFTRSGDAFTIVRGTAGTTGVAHSAQDRVQLVRSYVSKSPSFILNDILVNDCKVNPSYIPLAEWQEEETTYLQMLVSQDISEPTSSQDVINSLIQQTGLSVWPDDLAAKIRMRVIRGIPSDATLFSNSTNIKKGSFSVRDQPETRVSQVITRYGMRTPLLRPSDPTSFRAVRRDVDVDSELLYGSPSIIQINGTWIPALGSALAERVNILQLGRFSSPPRRFNFEVPRKSGIIPQMGMGCRFFWPGITQDATGADIDTPIQITRVKPTASGFAVEAEEMLVKIFDPADLSDRVIVIPADSFNLNLLSAHNTVYPPIEADDVGVVTVTFIIPVGVVVGSVSAALPAIEAGDWFSGLVPVLQVDGTLSGLGGRGGNGTISGGSAAGLPGGPALKTRVPLKLVNNNKVQGGGGGGGGGTGSSAFGPGSGGGGGAGAPPGAGGARANSSAQVGSPGTLTAGGAPGTLFFPGGPGGGPGQPGGSGGPKGAAGAAGAAIDGHSFVDYDVTGTISGAQIN